MLILAGRQHRHRAIKHIRSRVELFLMTLNLIKESFPLPPSLHFLALLYDTLLGEGSSKTSVENAYFEKPMHGLLNFLHQDKLAFRLHISLDFLQALMVQGCPRTVAACVSQTDRQDGSWAAARRVVPVTMQKLGFAIRQMFCAFSLKKHTESRP